MEREARLVTTDQLQLIKTTVALGATNEELQLFLYDCQRQGVHPLDRLLHFTKRSGKYVSVTSIDLMRSRAADSGAYGGNDDAEFSGDTFSEDFCAKVTVYRIVAGTRCAFSATARWSEYKPVTGDSMWMRMPHTMLGKCAEALALRKAFPRQTAGLYEKAELEQVDRLVDAADVVAASIPRVVKPVAKPPATPVNPPATPVNPIVVKPVVVKLAAAFNPVAAVDKQVTINVEPTVIENGSAAIFEGMAASIPESETFTYTGLINRIAKKTGTNSTGPWICFSLLIDDGKTWVNTFSNDAGIIAESAVKENRKVTVLWEVDSKKRNKLVTIGLA